MSLPRLWIAVLLALAACASSTPGGNQIDSAGDDDSDATVDSPDPTDSPVDTPDPTDGDTTDTPNPVDGDMTDTSTIDGPSIDAPVDAPIDANNCPTQPCDLHQQCGCTSPLVCDLDFTDLVGTQCRAVNQAGTETSRCVGGTPPAAQSSYCSGGYVCVGSAPSARCEKYCDMSSDCQQPRGQCVIQLVNGTMDIPGATTCSSNCNPVNSAAGGCPAGDKCGFFTVNNALTGGTDRDIVDCTTPGAGAHGATCTTDATCASDTLCTTVSAQTRCRRVCNRTTGGSECAAIAGTSCIGFNPALTIGGTEYGVCAP